MDSPGLQVPGHTIHSLLRTSTGESVGFAFLLKTQVIDDLDSFGGLHLRQLSPISVVTEVEGGEGKTGPPFPAGMVEGVNRSQHESSSHLLQDISSSSSIQVLSTDSNKNSKDAESDQKLFNCIEATLGRSTDNNSAKKTTINTSMDAMVKTMAKEMLNLVNKSQKPPKSQAYIPSRVKELPDNVFQEYYVELPEICSKSLNSDGTTRQLKQKIHVKCKLCNSRITKNSFSQHMRNIHLPDETCGSCSKEFPASKILGHRRQCGKIKGADFSPKIIANSRTNSPELVVVKGRSTNKLVSTLSTHMSTLVGDSEAGPGGSEARPGGSEARPVGSEAGPGGLESKTCDSEDMMGHSGKLKGHSQNAETVELVEAGSGAGPGRSVDATRSLETSAVSSAAAAVGLKAAVGYSSSITGSSEIAAGVSETTEEKEKVSKAGINSLQAKIPIKDVVEITIRVGSKVYILMLSKRKKFKKAMKKMAARLGKEVGCLSFTVEGGRRLWGQELMEDLEGRTIVVTQMD